MQTVQRDISEPSVCPYCNSTRTYDYGMGMGSYDVGCLDCRYRWFEDWGPTYKEKEEKAVKGEKMKLLIDTEEFMPKEFLITVRELERQLKMHKSKYGNLPAGFREVKKLGRKEKDLYVSK